jgi:P-type Cu+ transporter
MAENTSNITLHIEGMDCSSCAMGITKSLQKKGLENVHVEFATGEATFLLGDKKKLPSIIDGINDLGYKVVDSKFREEQEGKMSTIEKRFYITLPFTVVLFSGHMFFSHESVFNQPLFQLLLCLPVFIIGILQFGKSAWGSLKIGVPNMDVLIFIGSTSAFIYSIIGAWMYYGTHEAHNYMFFETTATIITLVLLGNVFEHRSVKQTTTAISELSAIQVSKANLVSLSLGKEIITEIDYKDIQTGAILQVNTGDKVPVDGEIISGEASIDESMLTGESIPSEKSVTNKVIGGTIVLQGNFKMRAETVGGETVLAKIIELVKKAQQSKPAIQKLGDKVSAVFVPVVLVISVITFCINYFFISFPEGANALQESIMRSIAVLVISCPCAMGLATPTAVMVGIGRAARMGILIKGGSTLEKFATIKNIVFDKTGTLSTGDFKIKSINCQPGIHEGEVKEVLFFLEQHSSHPIAKSIVAELKGIPVLKTFNSINEEKGLGISAVDAQNNVYKVGSYKMVSGLIGDNTHTIYVVKNEVLMATVDLTDALKDGVKETIAKLKKNGIRSIMLSGDNKKKCEDIAQQVGIEKVYSEQLPAQKLAVIDMLNAQAPTAMVGDGINDAPALEKSTVGISIGNATQVAIQSAQIVLLKNNDLSMIVNAHLISKHTLITIKQNLFWAFFYNVVAIPIAAMGLLSPAVAALSMAFSDVIVVGNSIRLKTKKLK